MPAAAGAGRVREALEGATDGAPAITTAAGGGARGTFREVKLVDRELPGFATSVPRLAAIAAGLSFLIPAAPGGLGVFEAAGLAGAAAYGIGSSHALAYVLVLHAVSLFPFLVAGAVVLVLSAPRRRSAKDSDYDSGVVGV